MNNVKVVWVMYECVLFEGYFDSKFKFEFWSEYNIHHLCLIHVLSRKRFIIHESLFQPSSLVCFSLFQVFQPSSLVCCKKGGLPSHKMKMISLCNGVSLWICLALRWDEMLPLELKLNCWWECCLMYGHTSVSLWWMNLSFLAHHHHIVLLL